MDGEFVSIVPGTALFLWLNIVLTGLAAALLLWLIRRGRRNRP